MLIRTLSKTALHLSIPLAVLANASAAYADSSYQPYYYVDADTSSAPIYASAPTYATAPAYVTTPAPQPTVAPIYTPASQTTVPLSAAAPTASTTSDNIPGRNLAGANKTKDCDCHFPIEGLAAIHRADNDISFAFGGEYLNYKESVTPIPDSERGWMPSFALGYDHLSQNNWYAGLQTNLSFGDVVYEGALVDNSGNETPANTTTHETIADLSGKFGKGFDVGASSMLTPYVELGMQYWDRDITGVGRTVEDYYHFDSLGGLMFQTSPIERLVLSTYGAYGTTFANKMKTQDVPDFHLGSTGIYKVGGKVSYAVSKHIDIFTTMDFTHFRNVQSEYEPDLRRPVPSMPNFYYVDQEPSSYTNELASRVGISYSFE